MMNVVLPLSPLPYHLEMVDYLQAREPDLWKWFSADRLRAEHNDTVRMDLLKSTYRIEPDASPSLHAAAREVSEKMGLGAPLTLYQSAVTGALNMGLAYIPGEAHLILTGPVADTLTPVELRCVLGHEFTHFSLLEGWRDYLVASQLLDAMANDESASTAHVASARLFGLYTEVYCDRGAYQATSDLAATVSALVKIETGLTAVSAASYLRQSDEIFAKGHPRTEGVTHPETFIRVKATRLWVEEPLQEDRVLRDIIEGPLCLDELDLLGQQALTGATRRLITEFLRPRWLQTDLTLAHAQLFFDDFKPSPGMDVLEPDELPAGDDKVRDYFCYVLLDFAVADGDLEDAPLAAALLLADRLGLKERFFTLAVKELNLRKKQVETLEASAQTIVARASQEAGAS